MPLPTDADTPALLQAIRRYLAEGGDPYAGHIRGDLFNRWSKPGSPEYDPLKIYVVRRGVVQAVTEGD